MLKQLTALRGLLVEEQQKFITQAATSGMLPTDSAIRKISDIENAIMAVEHMIEDITPARSSKGAQKAS